MVLNDYRSQADGFMDPIAKKFIRFDPNSLTMVSLVFAIGAGVYFLFDSKLALVLASLFIIVNSLLDAVDGKVARMTGKANKKGDFLDHLVDRYSDVAIIAGITLGPWCHDWIGVLAIIGVFMTSYTGTQAQAIGLGRNYGGILGRADRMVLLILIPVVQALMTQVGYGSITISGYEITIIEGLMVWFAFAGNLTAVQRAKKAWKDMW